MSFTHSFVVGSGDVYSFWYTASGLTSPNGPRLTARYTDGTSNNTGAISVNAATPTKVSLPLSAGKTLQTVEMVEVGAGSSRIYEVAYEPGPPGQVTGLTVTQVSDAGNIGLSWPYVSGADTFDVEEDGTVVQTGVNQTTAIVSGRPYGTYAYRVRAVNTSGAGAWSGPVTVTTVAPPPPPPEPPSTSPTLSAGVTGRTLTVFWASVPGATSYEVDGLAPLGDATVTGTSYTFTGLSSNTPYSVRVRAVNGAGSGPWSEWYLARTADQSVEDTIYDGAQTSVNGTAGLLYTGIDAFGAIFPWAMGLIALVYLSFWVLRRGKKAAINAK